jgi:uncharacterized protein (DUF433 family)
MPATSDLTIKETACLAGVSSGVVEKALETKVLEASRPASRRGGRSRFLPVAAVAYLAALDAAKLADLPVRHKRALWAKIKGFETALKPVELAPETILKIDRLAAEPFARALRYVKARDRYITSSPEILGGTPVIVGTRITVYAVAVRLAGGESLEELCADYPYVHREAFEAAAIYAQANPLRGRPKRPWRDAA